jgi:hypothetical protein
MATRTIDIRIRVDATAGDLAGRLRTAWLDDQHVDIVVRGDAYRVELTRVAARDVEQ